MQDLARRSSPGVPGPRRFCAGWGGSPRSIIARCWFDSNILDHLLEGTAVNRFALANCSRDPALALAHRFLGDWQSWLMHSPLKRDQAGSIPAGPPARGGFAFAARWGRASPTRVCGIGRCGYALAF